MQLDSHLLFVGAVQILLLLLAISIHESAHAWTADRLGDPTARELGRVSLNPLRHLDPVGSLLMPILLVVAGGPVFGWARPTPVDVGKLRQPERDDILVTAAGPVANLAVAAVATLALSFSVAWLGQPAREAANLSLMQGLAAHGADLPYFPLVFTLVQLAFLNAFLAVFNLLPIPPLDGGQILLRLLPPTWGARLAAIRPFGFMIVICLAMLNVMTLLLLPVYLVLGLVINLS